MRTLASAILLAGCVSTGGGDDLPISPGLVLPPSAVLPSTIDDRSVGLQDGCFIYDAPDGTVAPVTDSAGRQLCVGD